MKKVLDKIDDFEKSINEKFDRLLYMTSLLTVLVVVWAIVVCLLLTI